VPAVRPVVFTETLTLFAPGVADSHVPPEAAAVKVLATPLTETVCGAGAVPPIWYAKLREAGLTVSVDAAAVTVNVTGTVFGLPVEPGAVTATEPVYVPAARPAVLMETLALFEPGVTDSHVPPEAAAVKVLATPPIESVCGAGAVPPTWYAKVSEAGLTVRVGAPAAGVSV